MLPHVTAGSSGLFFFFKLCKATLDMSDAISNVDIVSLIALKPSSSQIPNGQPMYEISMCLKSYLISGQIYWYTCLPKKGIGA